MNHDEDWAFAIWFEDVFFVRKRDAHDIANAVFIRGFPDWPTARDEAAKASLKAVENLTHQARRLQAAATYEAYLGVTEAGE